MKKSVEKLVTDISEGIENIIIQNAVIERAIERFDSLKETNAVLMRRSPDQSFESSGIKHFLDEMGISKFTKRDLRMTINKNNDLIEEFQELKWLFLASKEDLKNGEKHIASLFLLSILLDENYKDNEIFEIIKEVANINDTTDIIDSIVYTIDKDRLENFKFETVTGEEKEFYLSIGTRTLLERIEELDEKGQNFAQEILENLESLLINNHDQNRIATEKISEVLIYKENTYNESDIDELIEALRMIEASDNICLVMKRCLERNLEKRTKKEQEKFSKEKAKNVSKKVIQEKHYINDSEYRKLKKQVLEFYDLHTGELKKDLSYEETLEVASIMIKLDYDKQEVYAFLMRALKEQETKANIIASFIHDYNKYIYYLGKESLSDILGYLKEMMIVNDEDYAYWKSGVEEEISELNKKLPYKVDYEYELAKKM